MAEITKLSKLVRGSITQLMDDEDILAIRKKRGRKEGTYAHFVVLHKQDYNPYHPYVVHNLYINDELDPENLMGFYEGGDYFEEYEGAWKEFVRR